MRRLHLACVFVAVLGVGLLLVSRSPMSAQQAGGRDSDRQRRPRRHGDRAERARKRACGSSPRPPTCRRSS